ncbi:hypothetical protein NHQ30_002736 [Ciborinia camelliae]|nr:hypothetical protein NHQ30_002736 [Ciborinia camelliae]
MENNNNNAKGQPLQAHQHFVERQAGIAQQKNPPAEILEWLDEQQRQMAQHQEPAQQRQLPKQTRAQEVIAAKQAIKKRALEFDYSVLPQHPNLMIEKTQKDVHMVINLDFFQSISAPSMESLLAAIPKYAAIIPYLRVTILIKAPGLHYNIATYNARVKNIMKLIDIINNFWLSKLEVVAFLDSHNNFAQLKLAAGAYGLNFQNWKLAYKVPGIDIKWQVQIGSVYERRLRGVYKTEFLTQH